MPSNSLLIWSSRSASALDEIERAHRAVGGSAPGRRYATQQINHAYAVLLTSQFQRFCRDIHSESVDHLTAQPTSTGDRRLVLLRISLTEGRKLDIGNPNPGNIGSDFRRFGLDFWNAVLSHDQRNSARQAQLDQLCRWRNAIAHQDFSSEKLGNISSLTLREVQSWRSACRRLAESFDAVLSDHIASIIGRLPW